MSEQQAQHGVASNLAGEIDHHRHVLSASIAELQKRLRPSNLYEEARISAREAATSRLRSVAAVAGESANRASEVAQSSASSVIKEARERPLPAGALAAGAIWLVWRSVKGWSARQGAEPVARSRRRGTVAGAGVAMAAAGVAAYLLARNGEEGAAAPPALRRLGVWAVDNPIPIATACVVLGTLLDSGDGR